MPGEAGDRTSHWGFVDYAGGDLDEVLRKPDVKHFRFRAFVSSALNACDER